MSDKEDCNDQIPEPLVRLVVLKRLNSRYPDWVNRPEIVAKLRIVGCPDEMLRRVFAYLEERHFVKERNVGFWGSDGDGINSNEMRITSGGIDYFDQLSEEVRLQVEEMEKKIGF